MLFLQRMHPERVLRLGLGFTFLYSGWDLISNPYDWYGFVPAWFSAVVTPVMPLEMFLRVQGVGELLLAAALLAWFLPRRIVQIAAMLAVVHLFVILVGVGIDPVTFRDVGLLGAAIALLAHMSRS
ncbi:MAG: hypothetical protein A2679_01980 [Candidatus Sungbacteria bacterium RIFCSPHIGHO2_01_FULL_54_26]|uniref:DoxX family protein n=1 Tax=Candidatus Sungbacteria bacterium RIFCSPHIGHO2_02_FULL_53_17 TaxID=1802275 RepID=A0A1G2KX93_9BACT|nr:MAG: hypothetical protein A2679_01980 [Candidatus Sungbacteria bacterium RIFCSPHIGHO2_01_FULL_54_26]OHA04063.1 MAG: hypothetical protein A3C92_03795 [Candidatus Sungbacteria bacterium RIFCSPHIGHO2_02_FULL_53_17]